MRKPQTRLKQLLKNIKASYGDDITATTNTALLTLLAFVLSGCGGGGGGGGSSGGGGSGGGAVSLESLIPTNIDEGASDPATSNVTFQLLRSGTFDTELEDNNAVSDVTFSSSGTSATVNDGNYKMSLPATTNTTATAAFGSNSFDYRTGLDIYNPLNATFTTPASGNASTVYISELSTLASSVDNLSTLSQINTKFEHIDIPNENTDIASYDGKNDDDTNNNYVQKLNMQIASLKQYMETWLIKKLSMSSTDAEAKAKKAFEEFIKSQTKLNITDSADLSNYLRPKLLEQLTTEQQNSLSVADSNAFVADADALMDYIDGVDFNKLNNRNDPSYTDDEKKEIDAQIDKINMDANNLDVLINLEVKNTDGTDLASWPAVGTAYKGIITVSEYLDTNLIGLDMTLQSSSITFSNGVINHAILPLVNTTTVTNDGNSLQLRGASLPKDGQGSFIGDQTNELFAEFNFTINSANPQIEITMDESLLGGPGLYYFDVDWM